MILAKNVKRFRLKLDLKQVQLCIKIGAADEYISQIETARRTPTLKSLCKIAEALNVKPYQLLLDEDEIHSS